MKVRKFLSKRTINRELIIRSNKIKKQMGKMMELYIGGKNNNNPNNVKIFNRSVKKKKRDLISC